MKNLTLTGTDIEGYRARPKLKYTVTQVFTHVFEQQSSIKVAEY